MTAEIRAISGEWTRWAAGGAEAAVQTEMASDILFRLIYSEDLKVAILGVGEPLAPALQLRSILPAIA